LQQNIPDASVVAGKHWYPWGQPSVELHGEFGAGGVTAVEKQPVNAAQETHPRNVETVLE
jgi:hypothetical protein